MFFCVFFLETEHGIKTKIISADFSLGGQAIEIIKQELGLLDIGILGKSASQLSICTNIIDVKIKKLVKLALQIIINKNLTLGLFCPTVGKTERLKWQKHSKICIIINSNGFIKLLDPKKEQDVNINNNKS